MYINFGNKTEYTPLIDYKGVVKISFDYTTLCSDDSKHEVGQWCEHVFAKKPTFQQIKNFILEEINKQIKEKILHDFVWMGKTVWLTQENQFNYKAAYDLAIQTNGANLPVTFKFGDSDNPLYHKFSTVDELSNFYIQAIKFIDEQLAIGWAKKDAINWDDYKIPQ